MVLYKRLLSLLIVLVFVISYSKTYSAASLFCNINCFEEIDMSDLAITISDTYTKNKCIMQADANENGDFATLTYYFAYAQDLNKDSAYFKKKFVDIFDNNGAFICELIFYTKIDPILRMSEECVYIFLIDTVLIYNINSREIKYYTFEATSSDNRFIESVEVRNEFEVGKWKYKLSKPQALGYRQLSRTCDSETQLLIDIPKQFDVGLILTLICVSAIILFRLMYKKRLIKPGDGSKPFSDGSVKFE